MDFGLLEKIEPSILHGLGYIGRLEKKNGNKQFFILRRLIAKRRKAAVNSASHLRRQIAKRRKAAVNSAFHLRRQTPKVPKAAVNLASHLRRQTAKVPKAAVNSAFHLRRQIAKVPKAAVIFGSRLRRQIAKRRKAAVNPASRLRRQTAKVPNAAVNQIGGCFCLRKEVERHGGKSDRLWFHLLGGCSRNTIFLYRIGLPLFVSYTKLMHSGIRQILWRQKNERDCSGSVIAKMLKFQGIPEAVPKRTQRDRRFCTLALVLTYKKYGSLY